jgi:hypothetical protein
VVEKISLHSLPRGFAETEAVRTKIESVRATDCGRSVNVEVTVQGVWLLDNLNGGHQVICFHDCLAERISWEAAAEEDRWPETLLMPSVRHFRSAAAVSDFQLQIAYAFRLDVLVICPRQVRLSSERSEVNPSWQTAFSADMEALRGRVEEISARSRELQRAVTQMENNLRALQKSVDKTPSLDMTRQTVVDQQKATLARPLRSNAPVKAAVPRNARPPAERQIALSRQPPGGIGWKGRIKRMFSG